MQAQACNDLPPFICQRLCQDRRPVDGFDGCVEGGRVGQRAVIAERTVRPLVIVVPSPLLAQHMSLSECAEDLVAEQFIVEALR